MMRFFLPLAWLVVTSLPAQVSMRDSSITFAYLSPAYTACIPAGDLSDRFGFTSLIGLETGVKFANHVYLAATGAFLFGGNVKEYTLGDIGFIYDPDLYVIGTDGKELLVSMYQRGWRFGFQAGKVFPLGGKTNPNAGPYLEIGPQYLSHRIQYQPRGDKIPFALSKDYRKGYDRLSAGFGATFGAGYKYISKFRLVNFTAGIELGLFPTSGQRSIQFDTGQPYTEKRFDMLVGLKFAYVLPLYRAASTSVFYY